VPQAPGDFGAALRHARLSARLTQSQLAHRSGLSTRAISDLERGRIGRPRNSSVDLLLTALAADEDVAAQLVRLASTTDGAQEQAREPLPDAGPSGPRQPHLAWELPAAFPDFTGRERELASMTDRASAGMTADRGAPAVLLVTGAPGVGKTALAVRLGHALAPAGSQVIQLFVELGGTGGALAPADGLRQMLSSLGVSDTECPADQEQRTRLYRSLLYRRRALVLLDDAADEAQVRPLLPAGPGCVVAITSRRTLEGLSPAIRMPLDVLRAEHALAFLGKVAGQRWLGVEEAAARQLVQLCGRLPLALRIAGNQLAARPHWPAARLVARLRDERTRLGLLTAGDLAVLRTFDVSYEQLSATAQVIFSRLPLLPGTSFTTEMVDVLCDSTEPAWPVVDELASASLIQATGPDRYQMHDLLRLYARGKLAEMEAPERIQAVERRVRARYRRRHLESA
jgi:transcriptional regulator with XRE-family HTH domain